MGFEAFIEHFGLIIEQSPLVAAAVWSQRPFLTLRSLQDAFIETLTDLPAPTKVGLLRCHHELTEKDALSKASTHEQTNAGLLSLTVSERDELRALNGAYREKFGFPFIICVRENQMPAIFSGIRTRLENTPAKEVEVGLGEVCKVTRLRLSDIVAGGDATLKAKL